MRIVFGSPEAIREFPEALRLCIWLYLVVKVQGLGFGVSGFDAGLGLRAIYPFGSCLAMVRSVAFSKTP